MPNGLFDFANLRIARSILVRLQNITRPHTVGFAGEVTEIAPGDAGENKSQTAISDRYSLPPGFAAIILKDEEGGEFSIVGSSPPQSYETGLLAGNMWGTPNVVWLVRALMKEPGIFIDVGANIGCVSIPIALDGNTVIAIEMIPKNCLKLQLSRLYNNLPKMQIFQTAASSEDGTLEYGGVEAWGMVGHGTQEASSLRLDTIVKIAELGLDVPVSKIAVIKIDVEGHELSVLKGALSLIEISRPAIIFESIQDAGDTSDTIALKCKVFLASLRYKLFLQYGTVLAPRSAADLQEGLVSDYLAIPEERDDIVASLNVRPLTLEERLTIIQQDAREDSLRHQDHAKAALALLQGDAHETLS